MLQATDIFTIVEMTAIAPIMVTPAFILTHLKHISSATPVVFRPFSVGLDYLLLSVSRYPWPTGREVLTSLPVYSSTRIP